MNHTIVCCIDLITPVAGIALQRLCCYEISSAKTTIFCLLHYSSLNFRDFMMWHWPHKIYSILIEIHINRYSKENAFVFQMFYNSGLVRNSTLLNYFFCRMLYHIFHTSSLQVNIYSDRTAFYLVNCFLRHQTFRSLKTLFVVWLSRWPFRQP